jgi:hypothetical protein
MIKGKGDDMGKAKDMNVINQGMETLEEQCKAQK